jgi:DNA-binding CsgD family transcriptional regulator
MLQVDSARVVAYLLKAGHTTAQVAEILGCDFWPLYRFIRSAKLNVSMTARNGKKLSDETKNEIRRMLMVEDLSPLEISRRLKLRSRTTIYCMIADMRKHEQRKAGEFQPVARSGWCPTHGEVTQWPCVACEAIEHRQKNRKDVLLQI